MLADKKTGKALGRDGSGGEQEWGWAGGGSRAQIFLQVSPKAGLGVRDKVMQKEDSLRPGMSQTIGMFPPPHQACSGGGWAQAPKESLGLKGPEASSSSHHSG
jgi:hypothetical protein